MMCSPATGCNKFFPSRSYADGGADYVLLDVLDDNSWLIFVEDLLHFKKSVHSAKIHSLCPTFYMYSVQDHFYFSDPLC